MGVVTSVGLVNQMGGLECPEDLEVPLRISSVALRRMD